MRVLIISSLLVFSTVSADADRKRTAVREDEREAKELKRRPKKPGAQSFGAPWDGYLQNATKFTMRGVYIRRPSRAFGTHKTVDFTKRAIRETRERHSHVHPLAIGDLSAETGGFVSDHHSHQSGRDVDLGLYYKKEPAGYPSVFIDGNQSNLDIPAMWTLISKLAATANKDGGVQIIFLDHEVQGVIYRWAKKKKVSDAKLERIFQYASGRGANAGIVRHYRNHQHHLHVRFNCTRAERNCRQ